MSEEEKNRQPAANAEGNHSNQHRRHHHRGGGKKPQNSENHTENRVQGEPRSANGEITVRPQYLTPKPQPNANGAQTNAQPSSNGAQNQENRGKHRNHRGHRGHGGSNPNREQNQPAQNAPAIETEQKPQSNQNRPNEQKNNRNRHNRDRRGDRQGHGLADLYGKPTENDALSLEELRAKIVLKSADGSVPEAPHEEPKPAAPSFSEPIAEPVSFPTEEKSEEPIATEIPPEEILSPIPDVEVPPVAGDEMIEVIGIRFRSSGKIYYFDPKGKKLRRGDFAIVETARGPEFGEVAFANRSVAKKNTVTPLRPLVRIATEEDISHNEENRRREDEALIICKKKVFEHELEMKLIDAQFAFDNSKLLFYFTSEGRVDFRDLVRDLAGVFHTRIELRQIGIRDEAKLLGGLGACGRPLCCSSFLPDFVQVSIKMAKEQGLSLNSTKISGTCGRLMCCLRYEAETYAEEIKRTPSNDASVKTPDGIGVVIGSNPLAGTVKVLFRDGNDTTQRQYSRDEVTVLPKDRKATEEKPS